MDEDKLARMQALQARLQQKNVINFQKFPRNFKANIQKLFF